MPRPGASLRTPNGRSCFCTSIEELHNPPSKACKSTQQWWSRSRSELFVTQLAVTQVVWFDTTMCSRSQASAVVIASVMYWLALAPLAMADDRTTHPAEAPAREAQSSDGDAALRGLLGGKSSGVDPGVAQLEAAWTELSERPLAKTAGKPGLDRARQELTRLHQLIERRADPQAIARRKQLVWAALSLSDRQMARAELAAALQTALQRREQAEAQLKAAQATPDRSREPAK
jgi:hypothetical protein